MFGRKSTEAVNIGSGSYFFHWSETSNVPKILQKGIYSPQFAKRIHDSAYKIARSLDNEEGVYLSPELYSSYVGMEAVGFMVRKQGFTDGANFYVRRRIKPRDIRALLVLDRNPAFADTILKDKDINIWRNHAMMQSENILEICKDNDFIVHIPIYGTSGEQYYPRRQRRFRGLFF